MATWEMTQNHYYYGRSMASTFTVGDRLETVPTPLAEIQPGDIIIYKGADGEAHERIHRVIGVEPGKLRTQGDNNHHPDRQPVTERELVGRVIQRIDRHGQKMAVVNGEPGRRWFKRCQRRLLTKRIIWNLIKIPYRWFRKYQCLSRLWQPRIVKIHLSSPQQEIIKYLHKGKKVAEFWPQSGKFVCKKPYDLVIREPSIAEKLRG